MREFGCGLRWPRDHARLLRLLSGLRARLERLERRGCFASIHGSATAAWRCVGTRVHIRSKEPAPRNTQGKQGRHSTALRVKQRNQGKVKNAGWQPALPTAGDEIGSISAAPQKRVGGTPVVRTARRRMMRYN